MNDAARASGLTGINHVTLAVSNLDLSIAFYRDVLGCKLRAIWADGAYLEAGSLWVCLALDDAVTERRTPDYSHLAFSVLECEFDVVSSRIAKVATLWKDNRSEGKSTYFLDPDGHKLELHCGSLQSRLEHYRMHPSKGVTVMDDVFVGS
jgi:catechol 2,3-dioxygenase-like lactoylglutathione lyase family enzyme